MQQDEESDLFNLNLLLPVCVGLHEEVDYSEKLKFSDDEEDHSPGDKNKIW